VPDGQVVEDGPEVDVAAERALWGERDRLAGGDGDGGDLREFVADLHGGAGGADHDDPLPGERGRCTVLGRVQHRAGEGIQAGQPRAVRRPERAGRDDHHGRGQLGAVLDVDGEPFAVAAE
jgi:hypothetical protein